MTPALTTAHTPRARGWRPRARGRRSSAGERSIAVDLSLRTKTLPVLPRRPRRRRTAAVLRPPWVPHRPLPRAGSPLVRPAGGTRRPTGGVETGTCSRQMSPTNPPGRRGRIRTFIWVPISHPVTYPYVMHSQADTTLIWEMSALISGSLQMEGLI